VLSPPQPQQHIIGRTADRSSHRHWYGKHIQASAAYIDCTSHHHLQLTKAPFAVQAIPLASINTAFPMPGDPRKHHHHAPTHTLQPAISAVLGGVSLLNREPCTVPLNCDDCTAAAHCNYPCLLHVQSFLTACHHTQPHQAQPRAIYTRTATAAAQLTPQHPGHKAAVKHRTKTTHRFHAFSDASPCQPTLPTKIEARQKRSSLQDTTHAAGCLQRTCTSPTF
jgi:hypothetical protein